MAVQKRLYTAQAFEQFIQQPENQDRHLELVGGEIVEVVSNNYASMIAAYLAAYLVTFTEEYALGRVTGADGGYSVAGERYIPDVGFISRQRQPEPCRESWNSLAPDLAVEVISPTDDERVLRIKVTNYLAAGTVVWVVDPEAQAIDIHAPGQPVQVLTTDDTLDGGLLLPGFKLSVRQIFDR
ncbi:MAG: Uma2 family endonuclease [Anaerolineae bacterium]|nr:Uma2 family endonuclease [Anaerolineae bacterium]